MKKFLIGCCLFAAMAAGAQQSERLYFTAPIMYPEGVVYHPEKKMFYVSSVTTGTIGSVDNAGMYTQVLKDPALRSTFGMKVDPRTNRLLVCVSDPNNSKFSTPATFKKMGRLIAVDLNSNKKVMDVDLARLAPGNHFINDLTLDDKGNVYITDSYAAVIYKVDASGKPSVFSKSEFFKSPDVGLNGIVYHPQGFLLAAHNTSGTIYKIDGRNGNNVSKVKMNMLFPGADGLMLSGNNLVLVQNGGANKVYQISSTDNWSSAKVTGATATAERLNFPTTLAMQEGSLWVLNAKLNELTDSTVGPSKEFWLQKTVFMPMQ